MGWSNVETDRRDRGHIEVCGKGPADTMGTRTGMTFTPSRRQAVTSLNYAVLKYVHAFPSPGSYEPVVSQDDFKQLKVELTLPKAATLKHIYHTEQTYDTFFSLLLNIRVDARG